MKKMLLLVTTFLLVGCNNTPPVVSSENNEVISMSINDRLGQDYKYDIPEVDSLTLSDVFPSQAWSYSIPSQ